jgi:DNA-binding NtrC family response regulator
MAYLFKQQFNIAEFIPKPSKQPIILIVEPDIYLAKLSERYLLAAGYDVSHCRNVDAIDDALHFINPTVLLLNPEVYGHAGRAAEAIGRLMNGLPHLRVVTISHEAVAEDLRRLMSTGIVSHINRKFSRPDDVVTLIKALN